MKIYAVTIGIALLIAATVIGITFLAIESYKNSSVASGVIVDRHYRGSYTTFITHHSGKSTYTTPVYHAPSWTITIQGVNKDGETRCRTLNVDETSYNRHEMGQEVNAVDL